MHRFFIKSFDKRAARAPLSPEEAAHALRVLRLKDLSEVQALDGEGGLWRAVLHAGDGGWLEILSPLPGAEAPVRVTLYMGIPKGDKMEFLAQKLTELGADCLVPVRMQRCVAKIDDGDAAKKLARFQKIAQEAQKQCGRAGEMQILPPMNFAPAMERLASHEIALAMWEEARGARISDIKAQKPCAKDIAYVIGPEGGIAPEEAAAMARAGAAQVTMGPRILRAETAAIAGCAAIMTLWGDL